MTDVMLDQILEETREPEPMDEAFVRGVMTEIHSHEQRRWRMRLVRRPVVFGVAAAVLATSGAVAALVGTHDAPKQAASASQRPGVAHVSVTVPPARSVAGVASPSASTTSSSRVAPATPVSGLHWGFPSLHTAYVVDDQTGLKLTTETYTNDFKSGKVQRVTLTLLNTSSDPVAVSGLDGCALEVIATPAGGKSSSPVCATDGVSSDRVVLAPGGFYTANADVSLPSAGGWNIVGQCACQYTQPTKPQATRSSDPLSDLLNRAAPPPLLPAKNNPAAGVARLTTPAISVKTSS